MILSADTDFNWLIHSKNMSSDFHQFLYVPVFEDGGTCGTWYYTQAAKASKLEELGFAGIIANNLTSNRNINCPIIIDSR